jgi:fructokinase
MRIGVDLGGTKIEFIAISDNGTILGRNRVSTPKNDYRATITAIK